MNFAKYERARFYRTLLNLRKSNPALAANASFQQIPVGDENSVYAYVRARDGRKVFVILNLSAKEQSIKVNDPNLHGNTFNVFKDAKESLTNKEWKMEPWGYVVYEYK
jgi:glycosidase